MVLSTGVGGAIQMVLFLGAAAITATSLDSYDTGGSVALGAIALVAALIGIILWIPKVRNKVVPAVKKAASDIWAVLRNPRKGAKLFGGDLAGNLIYPFLLGLCLLAFHQQLDFAQLMVVQIGAGMLANAAPVPGGIGVQEAGLMAGLTAFGVPTNPALATVLVFRTITFVLPPILGYLTLRRLRAAGHRVTVLVPRWCRSAPTSRSCVDPTAVHTHVSKLAANAPTRHQYPSRHSCACGSAPSCPVHHRTSPSSASDASNEQGQPIVRHRRLLMNSLYPPIRPAHGCGSRRAGRLAAAAPPERQKSALVRGRVRRRVL